MWAVLNGMFKMAYLLINLDNQECAKALIASEVCSKLSQNELVPENHKKKFVLSAE